MNKALVVARWEYWEKVKSKAFIISLFLTPVIMIGMAILPGFFATQEDKDTKVIGIIDLSGEVAGVFTKRMQERYKLPNGQPRYIIDPIAVGRNTDVNLARGKGDAKVAAEQIEGYFIVGRNPMSDSLLEYRARNVGDFRIGDRIEENLRQIIGEKKIASLGLDPSLLKQLNVSLNLRSVKLSESGEEEGGFEKAFLAAYVFPMMLFFLILSSGQLLVRSVIEEKANRIVEVLVSSCSPTELMAGKVLGLSALGFTQIGFWALMGIATSLQFNVTLIPLPQALLMVVYFVLGYLFYAGVFIALGSPLTTEQEAQQVNSYLVLILIIPLVIVLPALQNPNAAWIRVLTFVPLLTPTMMALRISIQTPPLVEVVSTVALMVISIYAAMWAAGRIFRVAILATGKRPTLAEIARWVRRG